MTEFAKRAEIFDSELLSLGVAVGSHVNTWGDIIRPILVERGMDPALLEIGSLKVRYWREPTTNSTVFETVDA